MGQSSSRIHADKEAAGNPGCFLSLFAAKRIEKRDANDTRQRSSGQWPLPGEVASFAISVLDSPGDLVGHTRTLQLFIARRFAENLFDLTRHIGALATQCIAIHR
jgi:hypothetical protein